MYSNESTHFSLKARQSQFELLCEIVISACNTINMHIDYSQTISFLLSLTSQISVYKKGKHFVRKSTLNSLPLPYNLNFWLRKRVPKILEDLNFTHSQTYMHFLRLPLKSKGISK